MQARLMRACVLACWLLPSLALAQVPAKLAYQGRLLNADGTPVQGTESMVFTIYDSATGTNVLWSENQTVPVDDGFYAVVLGDVDPIPSSVFTGPELYLEVSVAGSTLSPRQRIDSVAYSLLSQGLAGATTCSSGQIPKWTGSSWSCGDDANSGGTVTRVSGVSPIAVASGTSTPSISIAKAGASSNGYLSSTDWNTFNGKQSALTAGPGISLSGNTVSLGACASGQVWEYLSPGWACVTASTGTVTNVSAAAGTPLTVTSGSTTPVIGMSQAGSSSNGWLSSANWTTFNGKQARVTGTCTTGYMQTISATGSVTCGIPSTPTRQVFATPGNYTYTTPAGVRAIYVECLGGGGAGGLTQTGSYAAAAEAASGGNGGSYAASWIGNPAASYSITVGSAGVASSTYSGPGGASNFGGLVIGAGGYAGHSIGNVDEGAPNITTPYESWNSSTGDVVIPGDLGGTGRAVSTSFVVGGRGGRGAGPYGGPGAVETQGTSNGHNASTVYGGGGGGAASEPYGGGPQSGGNGASGIIVVTEFY